MPDYISRQVKKGLRSQQDDLIALRKRERRLLGTLNSFEDKHHLEEPAEYPESKIFHWSIVAAMVLVESIANSYFFAKGSDFGLIGGALQALMISVVNIFMALFGKLPVSKPNHISLARKFFAGAGVLAYGFFVLAFNLATAHYRALLEIDPITALVETIPNLKQGPFDFDNFDAAILLFIGIIFAIAAVIKSYKADSFYPGHGPLDRRHKAAEEEYRVARQKVREDAHNELDNGAKSAERIEGDARRAVFQQPVLLKQLDQFSGKYQSFNQELNRCQQALLQSYRDRNSIVWHSPAPDYFSNYPEITPDSDLGLDRLDKIRKEAEKGGFFKRDRKGNCEL